MSLVFSLPVRVVRWGMNLWPPLLGAGIRVRRISSDFREVEVDLELRWYNRNAHGSQFGGSLFAMTDPFFVLMLSRNLGPQYVVWDRSASIDFLAAGRTTVKAVLKLEQHDLDTIRTMTESGDKHLHLFKVDVVDREQLLVARVEKVVYVRRLRPAANGADSAAPSGSPRAPR